MWQIGVSKLLKRLPVNLLLIMLWQESFSTYSSAKMHLDQKVSLAVEKEVLLIFTLHKLQEKDCEKCHLWYMALSGLMQSFDYINR